MKLNILTAFNCVLLICQTKGQTTNGPASIRIKDCFHVRRQLQAVSSEDDQHLIGMEKESRGDDFDEDRDLNDMMEHEPPNLHAHRRLRSSSRAGDKTSETEL